MDYLSTTLGSAEKAQRLILSTLQQKMIGDVNLLYKIYFEGKRTADYPIEIADLRSKKIYYKTKDQLLIDENCSYLKSVLIGNLQNCYLKFCNHVIETNLDDNDIIFNDYDLNGIQTHILELSDDKKKDRIITGLLDQIKK